MTDSHEACRQDVGQEPADELIGRQRSNLLPVSISAVAVGEADLFVFAREQAMIGNRDPVGVASQVVEKFLRTGEGRLGVDVPRFSREFAPPAALPSGRTELDPVRRQVEFAELDQSCERLEVFSAKDLAERSDGEQELRVGCVPRSLIVCPSARGDDAMDVKMGAQLLVPRVQNQGEPDLAAEIVLAESEQGLGRRLK